MNRVPLLLMAALALFVSLSGVAQAQRSTPITGADIVDSTLTGADVQYASITRDDLGPESVGASELDLEIFRVWASSSDNSGVATAKCPAGSTLLSGGGGVSAEEPGAASKLALIKSAPTSSNGWTVQGGPIPYPPQKTNWDHDHDAKDAETLLRVNWKDWVWVDDFRVKGKWTVTATALCAGL